RVAIEERPLNGGRAAIPGKQGCVDIEATEARKIQNILRQYLAVCSNGNEFRLRIAESLDEFGVPRALGLENGKFSLRGEYLHRRRLELEVAAFGPIRLCDDGNDLAVGGLEQRVETSA